MLCFPIFQAKTPSASIFLKIDSSRTGDPSHEIRTHPEYDEMACAI